MKHTAMIRTMDDGSLAVYFEARHSHLVLMLVRWLYGVRTPGYRLARSSLGKEGEQS